MRTLSFAVIALLWVACDGNDISDDQRVYDASAGAIDATPGIDAIPGIDATPGIDAPPGTPDADVDRAQTFCDRYDSLCGYDMADMNRFDDEAACLGAFEGFDADQRDCVEGQLDDFETDGMTQHCGRAMGNGPCS
jgi:hypothetical protein